MLPARGVIFLPSNILPPNGLLSILHQVPGEVSRYKSPTELRRQRSREDYARCSISTWLPWLWDPTPYLREGPLSLATRGDRPVVWAEPSVKAKVPLISGGYRSLCSCLRKSSALSDPTSSSKAIFSSWVGQINPQGSKWLPGSPPIR